MFKNRPILYQGFTLIELLVVISIIGLLASVVLVSLNGARIKARDTKRIADISQVSKALELYAADHNGQYPQSDDAYSTYLGSSGCNGPVVVGGPNVTADPACGHCNRWCWLSDALKNYLNKMPKDPVNDGYTHFYYYNSSAAKGSQYYGIGFSLFEDSSNVTKFSNANGVFTGGYELGPSVSYCLSKYSGSLASWRWTGSTADCPSGLCVCWGGN